jgi:hypothetical protein
VASSPSLNMSTEPPSEALKGGLPMAVYATMRLTLNTVALTLSFPCTLSSLARN